MTSSQGWQPSGTPVPYQPPHSDHPAVQQSEPESAMQYRPYGASGRAPAMRPAALMRAARLRLRADQWQQVPPHAYPAAPPTPPKTSFWRSEKGAFTLLMAALFLAVALTPKAQSASPSAATAPTWSSASPVVPAAAVPAEPADDSTPAGSSRPKTSFGDGTWVVGEDIVAGTYKSAGAQSGAWP